MFYFGDRIYLFACSSVASINKLYSKQYENLAFWSHVHRCVYFHTLTSRTPLLIFIYVFYELKSIIFENDYKHTLSIGFGQSHERK